MQYRSFGNVDFVPSALGFGAMRLPQDEDEAVAIMQRAFELGVNYLDTAIIYTESESKCGACHQAANLACQGFGGFRSLP